MRNGSDVIVVGAGIVGSSAAYHLAKAGVKVTLVEQTHPAGGPSGKSSALLHAFYLMPELSQLSNPGVAAGNRGRRLFRHRNRHDVGLRQRQQGELDGGSRTHPRRGRAHRDIVTAGLCRRGTRLCLGQCRNGAVGAGIWLRRCLRRHQRYRPCRPRQRCQDHAEHVGREPPAAGRPHHRRHSD